MNVQNVLIHPEIQISILPFITLFFFIFFRWVGVWSQKMHTAYHTIYVVFLISRLKVSFHQSFSVILRRTENNGGILFRAISEDCGDCWATGPGCGGKEGWRLRFRWEAGELSSPHTTPHSSLTNTRCEPAQLICHRTRWVSGRHCTTPRITGSVRLIKWGSWPLMHYNLELPIIQQGVGGRGESLRWQKERNQLVFLQLCARSYSGMRQIQSG